MKTVCQLNQCTGCKLCVNLCPHNAINIVDTMKEINAVIDEQKCLNCGLCEKSCPNNIAVEKHPPLIWKQGYAADETIRMRGSSGGVASSMIENFITDGGYVCSCLYEHGDFIFKCTNDIETAKRFAGSKYVKSNPQEIYKEVKALLTQGNKVLFIGLPCQIAALQSYVPEKLNAELYTVDLICHGTPSVRLLELFLMQNGVKLTDVSDIAFRQKAGMGMRLKGEAFSIPGTVDRYLISFLNAINYAEHCYECQYAALERVSDVTLGDSWGTSMLEEMPKGVSLITVQTEKGKRLLEIAKLSLFDVDKDTAIKHNGNLVHPSVAPAERGTFFEKLKEGTDYNKLVMRYFPKQCWRQILKGIAIKLKVITPSGGIK